MVVLNVEGMIYCFTLCIHSQDDSYSTCNLDDSIWRDGVGPECLDEVDGKVVRLLIAVYILMTNVLFINLLTACVLR